MDNKLVGGGAASQAKLGLCFTGFGKQEGVVCRVLDSIAESCHKNNRFNSF